MNQKELKFYDEHGWLIIRGLLGSAMIADLNQAMQQMLDNREATKTRSFNDIKRSGGTQILQVIQAYRDQPLFRKHLYSEKFLEIASRLMRDPVVRLWHDQAIYKPAGHGGGVGWHQDHGYWQHVLPADMVTCGIALEKIDVENGCMKIIDKSHQWGLCDHDPSVFGNDDIEFAFKGLPADKLKEAKMIDVCLEPGDVCFHHCLTYHGSYDNTSSRSRKSYVLHFLNGHSRYNEAKDLSKGHEVSVPDGEIVTGEKFPLLYNGKVLPLASAC